MNMKKWMVVLLASLMIISLSVSTALAQGDGVVFCGDLPGEDCELLTQSQAAMRDLESAAFDLSLAFSFELPPDVDEFTATLAGSGAFALDPETLAQLASFQDMSPEDFDAETFREMMATMPQMLVSLLRNMAAKASFELILPDEVMAEREGIDELAWDMLMVDGVLYVNRSPLLFSGMTGGESAWVGIDLAGMYEGVFAWMDLDEMEEMMGEMGGFTDILESEFFTALYDPDYLAEFMSITRLEDAEVGGQTVAVFETTMDMQDYMNRVMEMQMEMLGEEAPEDFPALFNTLITTTMEGVTLRQVQWIGLEDRYIHHSEVHMMMDIDFEALAETLPEEADMDDAPERFSMTIDVAVDLSDFNEPVEVTAPEDAPVINPMMFGRPPAMQN